MRSLSLSQLFIKDFFLVKLPKFRWGSLNPNFSSFFCLSKDFIILNCFFFFLDLKKIICLVNTISFNKGICLSYFLDKFKDFFLKKELFVNNFYVIFVNKMFGFLSNFVFFLKHMDRYKYFTNYNSKRFPSIVFLSKKVWKTFDFFILLFIRLRLVSIKSLSFLDSQYNGIYNIFIGKCFSFFKMLRTLYFLNNLKFRKW